MSRFRVLPFAIEEGSRNMAVDEAILRRVGQGESPSTLRFYRWDPSAISLGCFQGIDYEVDLKRTEEEGVDVIRRISGGGTVFHDRDGEVTYSLVAPLNEVPADVVESFRMVCECLIAGFDKLGVDASYSEVNDVLVGGKKVSGSAQTRRHGAFLQHGTILVDPDIRLMFELLKVSEEKITDKFVSSVRKRVTSLSRELGRKPGFDEVRDAMIEGFAERLDGELYEGGLTSKERVSASELEEKYSSKEWTEKR